MALTKKFTKFKHIHLAGIEMEGCMRRDIPKSPGIEEGILHGEGMDLSPAEERIVREQNLYIGERNSIPSDNLIAIRKWIQKYYPTVYNHSNGFHVHVSFKNDAVRREIIASREFHAAFLAAAKKFVLDKRRGFSKAMIDRVVHGRNGYARHNYNPEERGAVHALSHHGTCEFRIFSGDQTPTQAKKCLTFIATFVEKYLDEHVPKWAARKSAAQKRAALNAMARKIGVKVGL